MKRLANPSLSALGETALAQYRQVLHEQEDLAGASRRNYLSDLRYFAAWYENNCKRNTDNTTVVFMFPSSKTNKALSERIFGYIVKKYADGAKLVDVSPHDLRHRFGCRMAESVPLHRLAQIMGHDSLDTTRLYIQGTKQDLQDAVETIAWA